VLLNQDIGFTNLKLLEELDKLDPNWAVVGEGVITMICSEITDPNCTPNWAGDYKSSLT